jgi:hypothetical protein
MVEDEKLDVQISSSFFVLFWSDSLTATQPNTIKKPLLVAAKQTALANTDEL